MKKYLSFLILLFLFTPLFAFADGGIFVPPRPDIYMQETRQRAAIFYENGVETLIVSTNFKGTAPDFGWVIPTPSRPEISKGSMDVFQNLETITQQSYQRDYGHALGGIRSSYQATEKTPYVAVIETKKIDYYNIDILESNDADALSRWLAEHNYHFPEKERYILNDYIENGWYFTAVKVDTAAQGSDRVNLALEEGHATPLKLVFSTPNIVFPLKISSIKPEPPETGQSIAQGGITFVNGVDSKGVLLPKNSYLMGAINAGSLMLDDVKLSFWFKTDPSIADNIYQLFSIRNGVNSRLTVSFIGSGISLETNDGIWTTENNAQIKSAIIDGWNNIRVEIKTGLVPKLYLNSRVFNLIDPQNPGTAKDARSPVYIFQGDSLVVGDQTNKWFSKSIAFDEVKITRNVIEALAISFSDDLLFYVNNYEGGNVYIEETLTPRAVEQQALKTTPPPVVQEGKPIPIELYVITNHRHYHPTFTTPYAGWIRAQTIKELGVDTNGNPLIQPAGKKYFLAKLTRTVKQEEMTEDIFPVKAANDDLINARELPLIASAGAVVWFVVISIIVSTGLLGLLIWWTMRKVK